MRQSDCVWEKNETHNAVEPGGGDEKKTNDAEIVRRRQKWSIKTVTIQLKSNSRSNETFIFYMTNVLSEIRDGEERQQSAEKNRFHFHHPTSSSSSCLALSWFVYAADDSSEWGVERLRKSENLHISLLHTHLPIIPWNECENLICFTFFLHLPFALSRSLPAQVSSLLCSGHNPSSRINDKEISSISSELKIAVDTVQRERREMNDSTRNSRTLKNKASGELTRFLEFVRFQRGQLGGWMVRRCVAVALNNNSHLIVLSSSRRRFSPGNFFLLFDLYSLL